MSGTEEKLEAIDKRLNQVEEYNTMLKKSIQKTDKRLSSVTGLTAAAQGGYLQLQASKDMKFAIGAAAPDLLSGAWKFANLFTDALLT
ncbi:unnamed protein product, partial [Rotaria socialis]